MNRILSITLTLVLLLGLCCSVSIAAEEEASVFVTIADKDGKLVLVQEEIEVKDIDSDGKLTINDALYCTHEAKFDGGAAAGYLSEMTEYGLSLKKLWGTDNGSGYGYYVNNAAAMSLSDQVFDGSSIVAFIYTDTTTWSDTFCYFDKDTVLMKASTDITLTLTSVGFDASYNTVLSPVANANITLNGKAVDTKTDGDGKITLSFTDAGTYVVSASSDSMTLVPPACVITIDGTPEVITPPISDDAPKTGDTAALAILALVAVGALVLIVVVKRNREA